MADLIAFKTSVTSVTGNDSRYGGNNSIAPSPPTKSESGFFRIAALKGKNESRLSAAAATAAAEVTTDLDADAVRQVNAAIQEAITVVSSVEFGEMPWIGVSDESVVTLQWQIADEGVALFFAGSGTFALSTKSSPTDHYTTDYAERRVAEGLPAAVRSKIARLSINRVRSTPV